MKGPRWISAKAGLKASNLGALAVRAQPEKPTPTQCIAPSKLNSRCANAAIAPGIYCSIHARRKKPKSRPKHNKSNLWFLSVREKNREWISLRVFVVQNPNVPIRLLFKNKTEEGECVTTTNDVVKHPNSKRFHPNWKPTDCIGFEKI